MGNTILIKHGAADEDGKIPTGVLQPYELGYCDSDGFLYIGQLTENNTCEAISIIPTLENARGVLQIKNGGTGADNTVDALINLGANDATNLTAGTLDSERLPIIPISKGGTGVESLTSGAALIGNGTEPVSTRNITNMTSKSYITYNTNLMTTNTLAYWNGAYSSAGASNLTYCVKGQFGSIVTKNSGDYLSISGGTLTGNLTLPASKYYTSDTFGLNCQNSDIIGINGLYFGDQTTGAGEGINFKNNDNTTTWDSLYAVNGQLRFHPNRALDTSLSGNVIVHTGNHFTSLASGKDVTTAGKSFTISSVGNYTAFLFYAQGNSSNANWMTLVVPKAMLSSTNKRFSITDGADAKHFNVSIDSSNTMTVTAVGYYGVGITATSFGVYGIR